MKDQIQYFVKNPHKVVQIVGGGRELEEIKRRIADGEQFEILGPANDPDHKGSGTSVELPAETEKNPLECLTCGFTAETLDDLTKHLEEHLDPSERSSTSETSSPTTSRKPTSPTPSKSSASKSSGSVKKTAKKRK